MRSYCYAGLKVNVYFRSHKVVRVTIGGEECGQAEELPSSLDLDFSGLSPFRRKVLKVVMRIPGGKVATYKTLAEAVGKPGASRAVGRVMATNPFTIVVPCHRVIKSNLEIGEYGSGKEIKKRLLRTEGVKIKGEKADRSHLLEEV